MEIKMKTLKYALFAAVLWGGVLLINVGVINLMGGKSGWATLIGIGAIAFSFFFLTDRK